MSRTACKTAARSVRLVIVLLLFTAWWEPLYMQANTRSVCTPYDYIMRSADAAGAPISEDAGQAEEKRVSGEQASDRSEEAKPQASEMSKDAEQVSEVQASDVPKEAAQVSEAQASETPAEAIGIARASKVYTVVATGYYAGVESTGKHPGHPQYGITYSGVRARRGIISTIAADLSIFPLGTLLYIPGYGYGVVADIGSAVKGNVIDLYFQTKEDVYKQWGKRTVEVIVIKDGDGHLDEQRLSELERMFRNQSSPPSAL
jgi:Uncharacterized protein conserved in bacteria